MSLDLETVIESSLQDAVESPETDLDTSLDSAPADPVEAAPEASSEPTDLSQSIEVDSPAARASKAQAPAQDEFAKANGLSGRDNPIPYSRVRKIVDKAVGEKAKELEGTYTPKVAEYEAKVKDYESRLGQVAQFEQIMTGNPDKFLEMLATLPAYKNFFGQVNQLYEQAQAQGQRTQADQQGPAAPAGDGMPEPDETLSDGTKVYSMDGLKALLAWNAKSVETKVRTEFDANYKPLKDEWDSRQRINRAVPVVQAQISKARTWPLFTENEGEIVKALQADQRVSLEQAYQAVVWPKMVADRQKMREELLAEIKATPTSTAASSRPTRPVSLTQSSGPRDIEAIIRESLQALK